MFPNGFMQIAWVVADLRGAMLRWIDVAKVGPFLVNPHASAHLTNAKYRDQPVSFDFSVAIAQAGPVQIELIEQHDAGPSVYRDSVPMGSEGLHHFACFVDNVGAEIERYRAIDAPTVLEGYFGDMHMAYVDTRAQFGHMIELLEHTPSIDGLFKYIADASREWDGSDPIRPFPTA
jgi:hypothetical protein